MSSSRIAVLNIGKYLQKFILGFNCMALHLPHVNMSSKHVSMVNIDKYFFYHPSSFTICTSTFSKLVEGS
jgi:hypothetical protein